jgi:hypothetical protein
MAQAVQDAPPDADFVARIQAEMEAEEAARRRPAAALPAGAPAAILAPALEMKGDDDREQKHQPSNPDPAPAAVPIAQAPAAALIVQAPAAVSSVADSQRRSIAVSREAALSRRAFLASQCDIFFGNGNAPVAAADPIAGSGLPAGYVSSARSLASLPVRHHEALIDATLPLFVSYTNATNDAERGAALLCIMAFPRVGLPRPSRGGQKWAGQSRSSKHIAEVLRAGAEAVLQSSSNVNVNAAAPEREAAPVAHLNIEQKRDSTHERLQRNALRALIHIRAGHLGKACGVLTQSPLPSQTAEMATKLRSLHPDATSAIPAPIPGAVRRPAVDEKQLQRILKRKVANGSGGGVSGWTGELLAIVAKNENVLHSLAMITRDIVNGVFTGTSAMQLLTACRLIGLAKGQPAAALNDQQPAAPAGVRPIAVGEPILKLASLYGLHTVEGAISPLFTSVQCGVGMPGGVEKAVHSIRAAIDRHGPGAIVVQTDISNAFNSVDRGRMVDSVLKTGSLSPIHQLFHGVYAQPSALLVYGNDGNLLANIPSQQGSRQGCQLASLGYSLVVQPLYLQALRTAKRAVTGVAIIDDFTLIGMPEDVLVVYDEFVKLARTINLTVQPKKSAGVWPYPTDAPVALQQEFSKRGLPTKLGNLEVLGAMIGPDDVASEKFVSQKVDEMNVFFDGIRNPYLPAQDKLQLLRKCGLPMPAYLTRVMPANITRRSMMRFDDRVLQTAVSVDLLDLPELSDLVEASRDDDPTAAVAQRPLLSALDKAPTNCSVAFAMLRLPIRAGGLGLRRVATTCDAAYLASSLSTVKMIEKIKPVVSWTAAQDRTIQQVNISLTRLRQSSPRLSEMLKSTAELQWSEMKVSEPIRHHQRSMVAALEAERLAALLASASTPVDAKARIRSTSVPGAGDWVTYGATAPSRIIDPESFRLLVRLRLGLDLARSLPKICACRARNGPPSTEMHASHLVSCNLISGPIATRHNAIVSFFARLARDVHLTVVQEAYEFQREHHNRPDLLITSNGSETVIVDASFTDPGAKSFRVAASKRALAAADLRVTKKTRQWAPLTQQHKAKFFALVVEAHGAWSKDAHSLLQWIAHKAAMSPQHRLDGFGVSTTGAGFTQRQYIRDVRIAVSFELQRHNAAIVRAGAQRLELARSDAARGAGGGGGGHEAVLQARIAHGQAVPAFVIDRAGDG